MPVNIAALKAAQAQGLVVGVVPDDGKQALRLEIDDFLLDTELANLYFLALEAFMAKGVSESPFSYYEISGIHGQPIRRWDGVRGDRYCHHGTVTFPTWHRVYLAQFEQAIFLHAADIAAKLKVEPVLDRFRIPYFDPFLPRRRMQSGAVGFTYGVPIILTLPEIRVRRPESPDRWVPMANPLYQFDFPPDQKGGFDWTGMSAAERAHTIRGLERRSAATGGIRANHAQIMADFDMSYNPATGLSSSQELSIYHVMFDTRNYVEMSNHANRARPSLEGFHDTIHVMFAGDGGHMGDPNWAGFDPVFWLHHCNVDRLLAIWQGLHSKSPESVAWWTTDRRETPQSAQLPFRRALGPGGDRANPRWWTSDDVRDHLKLGYDYPETAAARQQPDLVRALTAWANTALGWLASPRLPVDEGARDRLRAAFTKPVPFFPSPVLVDGRTPLRAGDAFIGSLAVQAPGPVVPPPQAAGTVSSSAALKEASQSLRLSAVAVAAVADDEPKDQTVLESRQPSEAELSPRLLRQNVLATALRPGPDCLHKRYGDAADVIDHHKMTHWNAAFSVEKFSLNGSFAVHFFLGDFDPEQRGWASSATLAGVSGVFASSRAAIDSGDCANCAQQEADGLRYHDMVPLTQALLTYLGRGDECYGHRVTDLTAEVVVPFLTRNLHWRVVNAAGEHVPREQIPSLKVMVYSETVFLPHEITDMPRFEDEVIHYDVTHGRPGGLNLGDTI